MRSGQSFVRLALEAGAGHLAVRIVSARGRERWGRARYRGEREERQGKEGRW